MGAIFRDRAPHAHTALALAALLLGAGPAHAQEAVGPPPGGGRGPAKPAPVLRETAPVAPMVPLSPGNWMIYRRSDSAAGTTTERWTVLPGGAYRGRPAVRLTDGKIVQILDPATRNWRATLRDGQEIAAAEPDRGSWSWPLTLGKRWVARFTFRDRRFNVSVGPIVTAWRVEAWESVTVPAGRFKAFRLRGEPGRNNTWQVVLWYAPRIALVVRRVDEQATDQRGVRRTVTLELLDHGAR